MKKLTFILREPLHYATNMVLYPHGREPQMNYNK